MTPISRRAAGKLLLAASASTLAGGRASTAEGPAPANPLGDFLSEQEPGLTRAERERLKKNLTDLQPALDTIRSFPMPNEIGPALRFQAVKSPGK
jgi:hypothetical protein